MNDPIIVTRDVVRRAWSDFEPKVVAGLLSGSAGAFAIPMLAQFGIHVNPIQANYIVVGVFFLGSYFTPSVGVTVTKTENTPSGGQVKTEAHSGNTVVTASVPIQAPAPTPPVVESPTLVSDRFSNILNNLPSSGGSILPASHDDDVKSNVTEILH